MKSLAQYLTEYINTEWGRLTVQVMTGKNSNKTDNLIELLRGWIEQGLDAYQSTENCIVSTVGGDCPDCDNLLERKDGTLYTIDGDDIDVCMFQCPECGYVVYG